MKKIFVLAAIVLFHGCAISPPFSGPKYDSQSKKLTVPSETKLILALTNGKLFRSKRKEFDAHSKEIYERLNEFPGYVGGTVKLQLLGDEVWTMTVWESHEALKNFRRSSIHERAKAESAEALKEFRHLNVEVYARDLPFTWEQAEKLLSEKQSSKYSK